MGCDLLGLLFDFIWPFGVMRAQFERPHFSRVSRSLPPQWCTPGVINPFLWGPQPSRTMENAAGLLGTGFPTPGLQTWFETASWLSWESFADRPYCPWAVKASPRKYTECETAFPLFSVLSRGGVAFYLFLFFLFWDCVDSTKVIPLSVVLHLDDESLHPLCWMVRSDPQMRRGLLDVFFFPLCTCFLVPSCPHAARAPPSNKNKSCAYFLGGLWNMQLWQPAYTHALIWRPNNQLCCHFLELWNNS